MSITRILAARSAIVKVGGKLVTLTKDDPVPAKLPKDQLERLERAGALRPLEAAHEQDPETNRERVADVQAMSSSQLADVIKTRELSSADTIGLADGDSQLAVKVLEAEQAATDGSPREDVKDALEELATKA